MRKKHKKQNQEEDTAHKDRRQGHTVKNLVQHPIIIKGLCEEENSPMVWARSGFFNLQSSAGLRWLLFLLDRLAISTMDVDSSWICTKHKLLKYNTLNKVLDVMHECFLWRKSQRYCSLASCHISVILGSKFSYHCQPIWLYQFRARYGFEPIYVLALDVEVCKYSMART